MQLRKDIINENSLPSLNDYVEPIQKNIENLKKLVENYTPDNSVTFVGAGTSKPLGIVDWEELIKELFDCCEKEFRTTNKQCLDDPEQWPKLADEIFQELKNKGKQRKYFEVIQSKMLPKNNTTTLTLIKMILAVRTCLTTNFDISIEAAYNFINYLSNHFKIKNKKSLIIKHIPEIEDLSDKNGSSIYYLHGNVKRNIYILRKTHYEQYYPTISKRSDGSKCIESCLKHFFKKRSIIFVGFSFADSYVREYLFALAKEIEQENKINQSFYHESGEVYNPNQITHFLLIEARDNYSSDKLLYDFEKFYILPIVYKKGQHIFIEKLFEQLSRRNYGY